MAERGRKITEALVWSTFAVWIAWDIYAVVQWGDQATESVVIGDYAERMSLLPLAFGVLCGHFFWRVPQDKVLWEYRHAVLIAVAGVFGIFDLIVNLGLNAAYPTWVVAVLPGLGFVLGHFFWPIHRKN